MSQEYTEHAVEKIVKEFFNSFGSISQTAYPNEDINMRVGDWWKEKLTSLHHTQTEEVEQARREEREKIILVMEEHAANRKRFNGQIISMIDRVKALTPNTHST